MDRRSVLVARLDNAGDVLLAGPAVRAVAAGARRVTLLCGPAGQAAAGLLPGVDEVLTFEAPWVPFEAPPVDRAAVDDLVDRLAARRLDAGVVLTSFHQSPLPLALLLRMAGVPRLGAVSVDYPGSLLDVRHRVDDDVHEVDRSLSLVRAMGFELPPGDDGRLAVRRPLPTLRPFDKPYVVVHPGASVPAREWWPERATALVDALVERRWRVAVTGAASEAALTAAVAGPPRPGVVDLGGATDLSGLAGVLDGAAVVVAGNTGPAHLAAAVGTPVVSIFAPVVPAMRWQPFGVPVALLGDQGVPCAGCRARVCPVPGQPCLAPVTVDAVLTAVEKLAASGPVVVTSERPHLARPCGVDDRLRLRTPSVPRSGRP
jgi:ADP-heptose:LPS heptosyltransferase